MVQEVLENIKRKIALEIEKVNDMSSIETLRIKYLGKKGELTNVLKAMKTVPSNERPAIGAAANNVREFLEQILKNKKTALSLEEENTKMLAEYIDVTLPAKRKCLGALHPLTTTLNEINEIFMGMGFSIAEGPEIETCYNSFDALNIDKKHPSRDMRDTFYVDEDTVLRPHTSSVQIRTMKTQKPPIKIVAPGRVYRKDEVDATHSPIFHQIEGLVVDESVSMADLKSTLSLFINKLYGETSQLRFRPHYFPFTEPSAEVDVLCFFCGGKGCRICKESGWIEILGAGMVHPKVLQICDIDPQKYNGFAFGVGLERIVMFKHNIDDLRLFYENDIRFLKQF